MREIRQNKQKPKNSKFFDQLIQRYGEEYALAKATNQEVSDKVKFFIQDLAYGTILQDKYIRYLMEDNDNRLINTTLIEVDYRLKRSSILLYALNKLYMSKDNICLDQEYQQCYQDEDIRVKAYSIIKQGLINFIQSRNPQFFTTIAVQLNSILLKGAKQLIS